MRNLGMVHMGKILDKYRDGYQDGEVVETEILELVKLKLYQRMHGLAPVLGALEFRVEGGEKGVQARQPGGVFRTDGKTFFLDAGRLRAEFLDGHRGNRAKGPETGSFGGSEWICLELLHMLGHCLLGHPFQAWRAENRKEWERECDRAAWHLAEELWGEELLFLQEAEQLWEEDRAEEAEKLLYVDSHDGWVRLDERQAAWWQGQGEKLRKNGTPKARRQAGTSRRSRMRRLVPAAGERGDYREILRGISSWREDARISQEEFQYSWYTYGLQLYGNLPLIEPLEYSEERKIADLVIVIDTSGSCEKELVRVFLEETRGILEQEKLFFRRFCLHIIQCDNQVQRDDCIHSKEELEKYLEEFTIRGGGGTDFRPAFQRIEELQRAGELLQLQGMLYFTDGCGRYPEKEPGYQVWFVMIKGHYDAIDMPGWIHRLVLEEKKQI